MPTPPSHPYASVLRQRAADLARLATAIEGALAMTLPESSVAAGWSTPRSRLCESMLERNLHQLHLAADDLRETALTFRRRADELDLAHRAA